MEYLEVGKLIATAVIFTWIGWALSKTKTSKKLLSNSEAFNDVILELQETVINEIQNSSKERGKMLLNQEAINKMIEENNRLNREIKESLKKTNKTPPNNEALNTLSSIKKDK